MLWSYPVYAKGDVLKKITTSQQEIHKQFWAMDYKNRRAYIHGHVRVQAKSWGRWQTKGKYQHKYSRF